MAEEKRDPAFLFYPGDASEDTQFLNRLERGCYFDLLKAQKKHKRFTLTLIKKVLGADFETCWPAIELILKNDGDFYFIEWVDTAIKDRAVHAAKQKKRIKDWWDKKKAEEAEKLNQTNTTEQPRIESGNTLEDEDASVNEIEDEDGNEDKGVQGEKGKSKLEIFAAIFSDELFIEQLTRGHKGKNPEEAFEQCYTHHISGPSPPVEIWEWKQKLNTWLSITKINGNGHKFKTGNRPNISNNSQGKTFGKWD